MSYVCNLFAIRLEDVLGKSGRHILNVIWELDFFTITERHQSSMVKLD
jgi:hypothetical protein